MERETIIVLDFGGQYNQLIARRVRECNVYCEVHPYNLSLDRIRELNPKGIIFTGGPNSVYGEGSVLCDKGIFELGIPILGICYGAQTMAHLLGGKVTTAPVSEYGKTEVETNQDGALFEGVSSKTICWMSHTDYIEQAPADFKVTAYTPVCPVAAMECPERKLYAVQFHPEVMHTAEGMKMLRNFVNQVCGCSGTWKMDSFVQTMIQEIRMDGQEVYKFATKQVPACIQDALDRVGLAVEDVDWFILHQANVRIIESVAKRLKVDIAKFPMNIHQIGNMSSATIPVLLDEWNRSGSIREGDRLVLSGFGAGLTYGASVLVW